MTDFDAGNSGYNSPTRGLTPWKPGQSGNPAGRPKGGKGLAAYIRESTVDGFEIVDFLIGVMKGESNKFTSTQDRLRAAGMLLDRGFGKAVERHELVDEGGHTLRTEPLVVPTHVVFEALQILQKAGVEEVLVSEQPQALNGKREDYG